MDRPDRNSTGFILFTDEGPRRCSRRRFYHVRKVEAVETGEWLELQREAKRVDALIRVKRQIESISSRDGSTMFDSSTELSTGDE